MITAAQALSLVEAIDRLYDAVVSDPAAWDEPALAAWVEDQAGAGEGPIDRAAARLLRRSVRQARKLARYWEGGTPPVDWRSAVDEALGTPGWEPALALARDVLDADPSEELFDLVRDRFRVVYFQPWAGGASFEAWMQARAAEPGTEMA